MGNTVKDIFKKSVLFCDLSDNDFEIISAELAEKTLPAKYLFIEQDDISSDIYFIISGSVRVYRITEDGEEINLAICGPGEILGEMSFLDSQPRSANVETLQETRVALLTRDSFKQILLSHPDLAFNLLRILSSRVRDTGQKLEDVLSKNLIERTSKLLETLAGFFPNREITLSHEELAEIVGATRARVTEVLDSLQETGKITLSHRKIHVTPSNI